jgi:hypothetical protein
MEREQAPKRLLSTKKGEKTKPEPTKVRRATLSPRPTKRACRSTQTDKSCHLWSRTNGASIFDSQPTRAPLTRQQGPHHPVRFPDCSREAQQSLTNTCSYLREGATPPRPLPTPKGSEWWLTVPTHVGRNPGGRSCCEVVKWNDDVSPIRIRCLSTDRHQDLLHRIPTSTNRYANMAESALRF